MNEETETFESRPKFKQEALTDARTYGKMEMESAME